MHNQTNRRPLTHGYGEIRYQIISLIRSTPIGVSASEIRIVLGLRTDQVYSALRLLKSQGLVANSRGIYRLTTPTQEE